MYPRRRADNHPSLRLPVRKAAPRTAGPVTVPIRLTPAGPPSQLLFRVDCRESRTPTDDVGRSAHVERSEEPVPFDSDLLLGLNPSVIVGKDRDISGGLP